MQTSDSIAPMGTLSLPIPSDSLETLSAKHRSYLYVLSLDRSLALATGYSALPGDIPSAECRATKEMPLLEREAFQAWRAGQSSSLPAMDWNNHQGSTPPSPRAFKRATRRTEALNRLYGTDRAEPCHSVWFTQEHPMWLPLVKAVARIIDYQDVDNNCAAFRKESCQEGGEYTHIIA